MNYGWGDKHTHRQTDRHTGTHINTMTRPGLRAGPSENAIYCTGVEKAILVIFKNGFLKTTATLMKTTALVMKTKATLMKTTALVMKTTTLLMRTTSLVLKTTPLVGREAMAHAGLV